MRLAYLSLSDWRGRACIDGGDQFSGRLRRPSDSRRKRILARLPTEFLRRPHLRTDARDLLPDRYARTHARTRGNISLAVVL